MNTRKTTNLPRNTDLTAIKRTLFAAAHAASAITLPAFRSGLNVDNKEDTHFDPVTEADQTAELIIRKTIEENFPDHTIVGEEHENKITSSPFSWIIDPIDGTRSFISGVPMWGTLIGVAYEGITFAGIMVQPFTGETYLGMPGISTFQRHTNKAQTISTSGIENLSEARLFTTTPALFEGEMAQTYAELESKIRLPRYGCDCYAYCLMAAGHADLVVETALKIYDIAALIPIVRNAGGIITNFQGNDPDDSGNIIAAATPQLHAGALAIMGKN
ncbi:MAG: histidinol-phosphatase [Devosiaceae bacterium]|nr:histidinol-phosphatase [Devosiaceae bacterium]